jgi:hypothetical protein
MRRSFSMESFHDAQLRQNRNPDLLFLNNFGRFGGPDPEPDTRQEAGDRRG